MRLRKEQPATFQEQTVPTGARLVGVAALAHELDVAAPVRRPNFVAEQHVRGSRRAEGAWTVFDKRYWPGETVGDHLEFLLRHEDIDLLFLKRLFVALPPAVLEEMVLGDPDRVDPEPLGLLAQPVVLAASGGDGLAVDTRGNLYLTRPVLKTIFVVDPAVSKARLPSLLLQPLVENAIKYAVSQQESGAEITIAATLVGPNLRISVSDTGPGLPPHIGRHAFERAAVVFQRHLGDEARAGLAGRLGEGVGRAVRGYGAWILVPGETANMSVHHHVDDDDVCPVPGGRRFEQVHHRWTWIR